MPHNDRVKKIPCRTTIIPVSSHGDIVSQIVFHIAEREPWRVYPALFGAKEKIKKKIGIRGIRRFLYYFRHDLDSSALARVVKY